LREYSRYRPEPSLRIMRLALRATSLFPVSSGRGQFQYAASHPEAAYVPASELVFL
jgi:hypothetical protein